MKPHALMQSKKPLKTLVEMVYLVLYCMNAGSTLSAETMDRLPVPGKVTMLGFGIDLCIPCRELAQTLRKLEVRYGLDVAVVYIDMWKYPEIAEMFNVQWVPTQLFFDIKGREVFRHEDVMSEEAIIRRIDRLFVNQEVQ